MFHVGYRDVSGITVTKTITKPESLFKALSMMNRRIESIESRSSSKCDCSLSLKKKTMQIFIYNSKIGVVLFNNENIFLTLGLEWVKINFREKMCHDIALLRFTRTFFSCSVCIKVRFVIKMIMGRFIIF